MSNTITEFGIKTNYFRIITFFLYLVLYHNILIGSIFRVSGYFRLVSLLSRLHFLSLFHENRITPSCHPSRCAHRQLWYSLLWEKSRSFWCFSWWEKNQLKEDKTNPDIIAYGFGEYRTIQDYPIRGRSIYLHVRKRKWLDKSSNEIFSYDWDSSEFKGTRLNAEFVSFLKEGDWIDFCQYMQAGRMIRCKRTDALQAIQGECQRLSGVDATRARTWLYPLSWEPWRESFPGWDLSE